METKPLPAFRFTAQHGFALVTTLMLMVLLALLTVGMLSLAAVTQRSSSGDAAMLKARANARMSLMIAIGELQKTMGPDKSISARGVTMAQHPAVGASVPADSARAWWVGVASSDNTALIGSQQKPVIWLVSGLDSQASPADQIGAASFSGREITLFDENSINLTLTGGQAITAGAVPVVDQVTGKTTGSYAYFVDDNGMKAQLAASHPKVSNDDVGSGRLAGSVIPGSFDLSILDGMNGMNGVTPEDYQKLASYNSLALLGTNGIPIARDKRLAFTTQSLGVLADVKHGGLKKDLTIAFEKRTTSATTKNGGTYPNMPSYPVFDKTFPKTSATEWGEYLLVDESKRSEFGAPGYIHWAMLRDYYNMKRYIIRDNGRDCLTPIAFHHAGMNGYLSGNYARGILPPHTLGTGAEIPTQLIGLPYGDFQQLPNTSGRLHEEYLEYYKHSPLMPVLAEFQYNCWLEKAAPKPPYLATNPGPNTTEALRTNVQLWASHYNPYNIDLWFNAQNSTRSFTMRNLPQVNFIVNRSEVPALDMPGDGNSGWSYTPTTIILPGTVGMQSLRNYAVNSVEHLGPGRAMFCAFENDVELTNKNAAPGMTYGTNVRDLVVEKLYRDFNVAGTLPPTLNWQVNFGDTGLTLPGVGNNNYVVSQFLLDFLPKNAGATTNADKQAYKFNNLPPSSYNDNSKLCFGMRLRTTKEPGNSIRPLVDTNIRGFFMNNRWDHQALGTDVVAAYTHMDSEAENDMGRVPQMSTESSGKGHGYWGAEHGPFLGHDRVILFDVPRQDLVSLGQLQHAGVGRFSYEPSYVIGNSYANPRIPLDNWKTMLTDTTNYRYKIAGSFPIYDASYLTNEALWDGYIFTTIPQEKDNYLDTDESVPDDAHFTKLLDRNELLPNPRFIPYEPQGSAFDKDTLQADNAVDYNAGHLLVDGAFNVNSTSVDAWEAFLSGTYGIPYQKMDENGVVTGFETMNEEKVRFPRVQSVFGEEMTSDNPDENYWVGFRSLEQSEVRELAKAIVEEVKKRGPFLSMSEFVNRKLENGELGEKGALQAALDKTVNKNPLADYDQPATHPKLPSGSNQAAGFPGQLLQGDILQALSPCMTVRSDSFTIRAYGDAINPVTGKIEAKAWCEAVVQRFPDPVPSSEAASFLSDLAEPSSPFGRQFRVTSFRWLNPDEI